MRVALLDAVSMRIENGSVPRCSLLYRETRLAPWPNPRGCAAITGESMAKQTAGILVYRRRAGAIEVFLAHPGGPFWAKKDAGAWSIPKGEFLDPETPLDAARREFAEEIGQPVDGGDGDFIILTPRKPPGGKTIHAFAIEGDVDATKVESNLFEMEWPPHSGKMQSFPEVDRGAWFGIEEARERLHKGQLPILEELIARLGENVAI